MTITQIKQAAETAKSRTNDKRWLAAIDKAVAGVESGWWIVTELHDCLAITTETGKTYFANGSCQCEAYKRSQACKHRACYRLYQIANEIEETAGVAVSVENSSPVGDEFSTTRAAIITSIKSRWPKDINLADELMARFRVNSLEFLADGFLRDILAVIA